MGGKPRALTIGQRRRRAEHRQHSAPENGPCLVASSLSNPLRQFEFLAGSRKPGNYVEGVHPRIVPEKRPFWKVTNYGRLSLSGRVLEESLAGQHVRRHFCQAGMGLWGGIQTPWQNPFGSAAMFIGWDLKAVY